MVNNSGVFSMYPQKDLEAAEWDRLFSINVRGLYLCSKAAAKHMSLNDKTGTGGYRGSIINMASINALHPGFGFTAHYDATKGAVYSYTRSLAAELGPEGIRVNAVAPGLVDSEGLRNEAGPLAEMVEGRNPLRTADGETRLVSGSDVADAVVFLASAMASSLTGETIVVDRGYLLT
jgi:NAD(P)-dependent dehydrogenase (short-subunit alcohol dehydrogenase family)